MNNNKLQSYMNLLREQADISGYKYDNNDFDDIEPVFIRWVLGEWAKSLGTFFLSR